MSAFSSLLCVITWNDLGLLLFLPAYRPFASILCPYRYDFFFSFLALSLEVNSFFSLCEDFLSGAFVCVTISSFLNTTLASSEPLSYLLPCHPRSHLKSCRRWQITQSPAVLQRLRFWLKSCLFLTDTSLSPQQVWWLWMAEGKVSQGLYDAFISK